MVNDYGGIEMIQEQEDVYKLPDTEEGTLKEAFCIDEEGNFIPIFFVKIGSRTIKLVKKLPSPECKVYAYLKY